ncbi:MAG: dephospho-CoA kinase [Bauldia sp.]
MFVLGLTGSAAMGKSTVAAMFAGEGTAVFDADAAVHRLYSGGAVEPVRAAFPAAIVNGAVDRAKLSEIAFADPTALKRLEAIVHPLVRGEETRLRARAVAEGRRLLVLDIPLLFETGGEARVDAVAVVSAPEEMQRKRLLSRPGMTEEKLAGILRRQLPDAEKRRRAHFIIDTSGALAATRRQLRDVLRAIAGAVAGR